MNIRKEKDQTKNLERKKIYLIKGFQIKVSDKIPFILLLFESQTKSNRVVLVNLLQAHISYAGLPKMDGQVGPKGGSEQLAYTISIRSMYSIWLCHNFFLS